MLIKYAYLVCVCFCTVCSITTLHSTSEVKDRFTLSVITFQVAAQDSALHPTFVPLVTLVVLTGELPCFAAANLLTLFHHHRLAGLTTTINIINNNTS